jgi:hypothetical protein
LPAASSAHEKPTWQHMSLKAEPSELEQRYVLGMQFAFCLARSGDRAGRRSAVLLGPLAAEASVKDIRHIMAHVDLVERSILI